MKADRRAGALLIAAVAVSLAVAGLTLTVSRNLDLRYTVIFHEGKNIRVGDWVRLSGVDIGEVESVDLDRGGARVLVGLKIDREHRDKVMADSTAYIGNVAFPNVSDQKIVEIHNGAGATAPMEPDAEIEGKDGLIELKIWQGLEKLDQVGERYTEGAEELGDGMKRYGEQLKDKAREYSESGKLDEVIDRILELAGRATEEKLEDANKLLNEWELLREEIDPALKDLTEAGREVLGKGIARMAESLTERLREISEEMDGPPAEESQPEDAETISI